jgi:hypothetical protein
MHWGFLTGTTEYILWGSLRNSAYLNLLRKLVWFLQCDFGPEVGHQEFLVCELTRTTVDGDEIYTRIMVPACGRCVHARTCQPSKMSQGLIVTSSLHVVNTGTIRNFSLKKMFSSQKKKREEKEINCLGSRKLHCE